MKELGAGTVFTPMPCRHWTFGGKCTNAQMQLGNLSLLSEVLCSQHVYACDGAHVPACDGAHVPACDGAHA